MGVKKQYAAPEAKQVHPDTGGSEEAFIALQNAARQAVNYLNQEG